MDKFPQKIKIQDRIEIPSEVYINSIDDNMGSTRPLKHLKQDIENLIKAYGEDSWFESEDISNCRCCPGEYVYYIVKSERLETDEEYEARMNKIKKEQDLEIKKKEEAKIKSAMKVLEESGFRVEKATWNNFHDMPVEDEDKQKDTFGEFGDMAVEEDE